MENIPTYKRISVEDKGNFSVIAWIINALAVGLATGTTVASIGFYLMANADSNLGPLYAFIITPTVFLVGLIMGFIGFSIYVWKTRIVGPASIGLAVIAIHVIVFAVIVLQASAKKEPLHPTSENPRVAFFSKVLLTAHST